MKNTGSEKIGIYKVVTYPKEIYALHYKGEPFSLSKLSYQEQRELGITYPSIGMISRKVYFAKQYAEIGRKNLPKELKDKVQIVKYIPETVCLEDKEFNEIMDMPLFKNKEGE